MDANRLAFLAMIQHAEGTDRAADPYKVCYGFTHTILDLADHPAVSGEWKGELLTDAQCLGVGLSPGCRSTAAGAYQINKPTWGSLGGVDRYGSFDRDAQDSAALDLIRRAHGLDYVDSGNPAGAIKACKSIWASLPGSVAPGQPQRALADLLDAFRAAGGEIVA